MQSALTKFHHRDAVNLKDGRECGVRLRDDDLDGASTVGKGEHLLDLPTRTWISPDHLRGECKTLAALSSQFSVGVPSSDSPLPFICLYLPNELFPMNKDKIYILLTKPRCLPSHSFFSPKASQPLLPIISFHLLAFFRAVVHCI